MKVQQSSPPREIFADAPIGPSQANAPETPEERLFDAIQNRDLEQFSQLIDNFPLDLSAKNADGQTPLHQAIASDQDDMAMMLLQKDKTYHTIDARDHRGYPAILFAAEKGNIRLMQALIKAGCRTDFYQCNVDDAKTLVFRARTLKSAQGNTTAAFARCIASNRLEDAKFFFSALTQDEVSGMVQYQALQHSSTGLKKLIDLGADWSQALKDLTEDLELGALEFLCRHGADLTATLIHFARQGDKESIHLLAGAGANPKDAIDRLLPANDTQTITFLMDNLVDTSQLLIDLMRDGRKHAARQLIDMGADVATAINKLLENNEQETANLLSIEMAKTLLPPKTAKTSTGKH